MKNRPLIAFLTFLISQYLLQNFVKQYKYHEADNLMELLPLAIASILVVGLSWNFIKTKSFSKTYLRLSFASIAGLAVAKAILFFQWYWTIAPQYRKIDNDMEIGFYWTLFELAGKGIAILILYLFAILVVKGVQRYKVQG
ncbi:MAG: hypothetical protein BGO31_00725 [Bacteroidetes bacterium 43-16]|nr:MAG: hypothetical protein BGO31_00725 [Bacteroidetes bacterium 43-16]